MASMAMDLSTFGSQNLSDYSASGNNDTSSQQSVLSGLGDLFSGVGAAISSGIASSQGPRPVGPVNAGVVYDPRTGQYTSVYGVASQQAMSPLLLLLIVGLVAVFAFKK